MTEMIKHGSFSCRFDNMERTHNANGKTVGEVGGGRWQVAGCAVQCSDWSDVDSGLQISRQVAATKTTQTSSFSR